MSPLLRSTRIASAKRSGKGVVISASTAPNPASEDYATGTFPGPGTYFCVECGSQLALHEDDELPLCPRCGSSNFRLDSIFESMQEHDGVTAEFEVPTDSSPSSWLADIRSKMTPGARRLACRDEDGEVLEFEIDEGWSRIGRSVTADVRLDDPSVSRRHALVVSEADEPLRVLDDRSLNGILVNGETVEWAKLDDGDELAIGRYRLFAIEG
jgi:hypothetical protein